MNSATPINLSDIPAPEIIKNVTFEELLADKKKIIQMIRPEWKPVESDDFSVIAESWAYDDLHHITRFNNAVKAMLLPYSTGADLDNLAVMYGVTRLPGTRPTAKYTFSLTGSFDETRVIEKGKVLISADGKYTASVCEDIVFKPKETNKTGTVELDACIRETDVKTRIFVNPIPYVKATAKPSPEGFTNGAVAESDKEFRERILLSLYSFSTAGSRESYVYWTQSADARIRDVSVTGHATGEKAGTVNIHILADTRDESIMKACKKTVTDAKRRPLTDKVEFHWAEPVMVNIKATIHAAAPSREATIVENRKKALESLEFKLGQGLPLSKIFATLHADGVLSVALAEPTKDIIAKHNQVIELGNIQINENNNKNDEVNE